MKAISYYYEDVGGEIKKIKSSEIEPWNRDFILDKINKGETKVICGFYTAIVKEV